MEITYVNQKKITVDMPRRLSIAVVTTLVLASWTFPLDWWAKKRGHNLSIKVPHAAPFLHLRLPLCHLLPRLRQIEQNLEGFFLLFCEYKPSPMHTGPKSSRLCWRGFEGYQVDIKWISSGYQVDIKWISSGYQVGLRIGDIAGEGLRVRISSGYAVRAHRSFRQRV